MRTDTKINQFNQCLQYLTRYFLILFLSLGASKKYKKIMTEFEKCVTLVFFGIPFCAFVFWFCFIREQDWGDY